MTRRQKPRACLGLTPRSTPASRWPAFLAYPPIDNEPRPFGVEDLGELLRMSAVALVAVVIGILLAPYLYAALARLSEVLS